MEKIATSAVLDKTIFNVVHKVWSLKIPVKILGDVQKKFKKYLLSLPKVRNVVNDDQAHKLLLLEREFKADPETLPDPLKEFVKENEISVGEYEVDIGYDNYNAHDALEKLLPKDVMIPVGFESVGHVAHMNLSEEHMPYKYQIGQIFLDKNPSIRTVLTKIGFIENVYRTFNYELIAGDNDLEATQVEDSVRFTVDVSKVYWCSRLGMERTRVINEFFKPGDILWDMFCGIGPLSVRAAKVKDMKVLANDLNPDCYHYLRKNIAQNKVADLVIPFWMDAREFVRHIVQESNNQEVLDKEVPITEDTKSPDDGGKKKKKKRNPTEKEELAKLVPEEQTISPIPNRSFLRFNHVYMNLPMDAVEFLDVFIGLFNKANPEIWDPENPEILPMIHVYGFTTENQDEEKAKEYFTNRIAEVFKSCGGFTSDQILRFHNNRDVSRVSSMYCISFKLSPSVAYYNEHKRLKTSEEGE